MARTGTRSGSASIGHRGHNPGAIRGAMALHRRPFPPRQFMDIAPVIRHKRADAGATAFRGRRMKGVTRQINELQKRIRKSVHSLCGGAFPGDDDPFLIRLDAVTLFAEDAPYARYHYQGKVMATLPGVIPHDKATVSQLKIEAMRQRIIEGTDWRDTRLFRDHYALQLRDKGRAKGATTLDALDAVYRTE